ncbi:MAG: DNA translocase FtsK 4TM domain-containing protein, partial [Candidatus Omnitrophica bacterium]|nr:DNA translocase FtsK 4TM domain-containing protein [Candidatus Omnitrophota bacterium]
MRKKHINEIYAVILFAAVVILFVSLFSFTSDDLSFYTSHPNITAKNVIRGFGAHIAGTLRFFFGIASYAFCLIGL